MCHVTRVVICAGAGGVAPLPLPPTAALAGQDEVGLGAAGDEEMRVWREGGIASGTGNFTVLATKSVFLDH